MNMTLKAKLAAAFSAILLLTGALGWLGITQMSSINDQSTVITENWLPSMDHAHRMNTGMADLRVREYRYIQADTAAEMRDEEQRISEGLEQLEKVQNEYEALISSSEEQAAYDAYVAGFARYREMHDRLMVLVQQN